MRLKVKEERPLKVVSRVAVSSPEQIIERSEGQISRWHLLSGRYSLTLLPQFHSRGRFLLIPALWVLEETARWDRNCFFFLMPFNVNAFVQ